MFLYESDVLEKSERLRFVRDLEGVLWFDVDEKAPVKEAVYLPCKKAFLTEKLKEGYFEKEFSSKVSESMEKNVTFALRSKLLASLSLAKKGGATLLGLEKVKECYHKGGINGVFLARDAGADVKKRVSSWKVKTCSDFTKAELSKALGGNNVSLVGLLAKPQIKNVWSAYKRYQAFL